MDGDIRLRSMTRDPTKRKRAKQGKMMRKKKNFRYESEKYNERFSEV